MEQGFIIFILVISASLPIGFLAWAFWVVLKKVRQWLVKTWNNFPAGFKSFLIILLLLFLSGCFIYWYKSSHGFFDPYLLSENELKLKGTEASSAINSSAEALSNIRRNIWLLAFAIFGGGLAIWARVVNQKQLENSAEINRNDRFAKAADMLDNIKNKISSRCGLYILRDLILEDPKAEYIRCIEVISYWVTEHIHKNIKADRYLLNVVAKILKIRSDHEELENILEEYKKENSLSYWPYFDTIDFKWAFLRYANLEGVSMKEADLRRANLSDANLRNANLEEAKMQRASLTRANLKGANLQIAKLQKAFLLETKLKRANLEGADMKKAILFRAGLQDANLKGANLKDAYLGDAYFDGANLTNAKMKDAKELTKEQILSAKWFKKSQDTRSVKIKGNTPENPPTLPDELMNDLEVQEWLNNPTPDEEGEYMKFSRIYLKKSMAKKATAKKATAKKATAKKAVAKKTIIKKDTAKKAVAKKVKAKAKAKKATAKKSKAKKPKN